MRLPIKTIKIGNAEVSLSDTSLIFNELDRIRESGVKYTEADIVERNKLINFLCSKYNFLMTLDSAYRDKELKIFYSEFDKYFDLEKVRNESDTSTSKDVNSKDAPKNNSAKETKSIGYEDRSIKMENSPGGVANTGDNVVITQQPIKSKYDYVPLSDDVYNIMLSKFQAIREKHGNETPKVVIDFENNSPQILKVNETLFGALEKSGIKVERRIGQYFEAKPCMKPHIVFSESLNEFVNEFVAGVSPYFKSQLTGYPNKSSDSFIRIRLCGTPAFGIDGSVIFE